MTMVNTLPPNDGKAYVWSIDEQKWIEESKEKDPLKEKWYKISEISKCFGISLDKIKYGVKKGHINYKKIPGRGRNGTVVYISDSALKEWMADPYKQRMDVATKVKVSKPVTLDPNEKWFTVEEAAKELHLEKSWTYRLTRKGLLKTVKSAGKTYVSETAMIEYLEKKRIKEKEAMEAAKMKSTIISGWNDISVAIQEFIQKQVETAVNEKLEAVKKTEYQKGFEDGKLSNTHDVEDSYRKGFEEGKKQAKKDLLTLIKEVG